MSKDLRCYLDNRKVDLGEKAFIEVVPVKAVENTVVLRELPEPVTDAA